MAAHGIVSDYAPLKPDGPLPPGFTVATLKGMLGKARLNPKRALRILGIRAPVGSPEDRLRRLVDTPAHRRTLVQNCDVLRVGTSFEGLLRSSVVNTAVGRGVHKRIFEPAAYESGSLMYVDPDRFAELFAEPRPDVPRDDGTLKPHCEGEALALLALAYGLRQPQHAAALLAPVLLLGRAYEAFFGVAQISSVSRIDTLVSRPATPTAPPAPGPPAEAEVSRSVPPIADAVSQVVLDDTVDVASPDSVPPPAGKTPSEVPTPRAETPIPTQPPTSGSLPPDKVAARAPSGPRALEFANRWAALEAARRERQLLGAADVLERASFDNAASLEDLYVRELQHLAARLQDDARALVVDLQNRIRPHAIMFTMHEPRAAEPADVATWLDDLEPVVDDFLSLLDEIGRNLDLVHELDPRRRSIPPVGAQCGSLEELGEVLRKRASDVSRAVQEASDWKGELAALRAKLADCRGPDASPGLRALSLDDIKGVLRRATIERRLEPLVPLMVRLLGERCGWGGIADTVDEYELLARFLERAARDRDSEFHAELLSFLTVPMLLGLLRSSDPGVTRHICLAAFRESLASHDALFFNHVWPCSDWTTRREAVGERAETLFSALHQLFVRTGSLQGVYRVVETAEDRRDGERQSAMERARAQQSESLALRLESPLGMSGHFRRLRVLTCQEFFKQLAAPVRQRRWRDVQRSVVEIERSLGSGSLVERVLAAFDTQQGSVRDLRNAHHESIKRLAQDLLRLLRDWIRDESAVEMPAQGRSFEPSLEAEASLAIESLLAAAGTAAPAPVGSLAWFESALCALITEIRADGVPEPSTAFCGVIASDAGWPALFAEPRPEQERLWVCHVEGKVSWEDLLQDRFAALLLDDSRTPLQTLESLLQHGHFEAAVAVERIAVYAELPGCTEVIERARDLLRRRDGAERRLDQLWEKVDELRGQGPEAEGSKAFAQLETSLIETSELIPKRPIPETEEAVASLECEIARLMTSLALRAKQQGLQRDALSNWIAEADPESPSRPHAPLSELLQREKAILEVAAPRRQHLTALAMLESREVPEVLRAAARSAREQLDQPSRWPNEDGAARAEFYLAYLAEVSATWWASLGVLEAGEPSYDRIHEVAEALAARLLDEVIAILEGKMDSAPMLTGLDKPGCDQFREYRNQVQAAGIVARPVQPGVEAPPADTPVAVIGAQAASDDGMRSRAEQKLRQIALDAGIPQGSGRSVADAMRAFGVSDWSRARELAGAAVAWCLSSGQDAQVSLLSAAFAWSQGQLNPDAGDAEILLDALGIMLGDHVELTRWAREIDDGMLLDWWLARAMDSSAASESSRALRLQRFLSDLLERPRAETRQGFVRMAGIAGSDVLAGVIWRNLAAADKATLQGRVSLLILLYDLHEDAGLTKLFGDTAEARRYLQAFLSLARRASADPSPKLHSALRQNLQTIQRLAVPVPIREFALKVVERLGFAAAEVTVSVEPVLERIPQSANYRLLVTARPDESDPPLSLSIHLNQEADFLPGGPVECIIANESLVYEAREVEFVVRPKNPASATTVSLSVTGETASGRRIEMLRRFQVELGTTESFERIPIEELLEIYEGYDGRPVSGSAFVGREDEIAKLTRVVGGERPGAAIVYGVRRLGKTSLLGELRRRRCCTSNAQSRTLFVVVQVDLFEDPDSPEQYLDKFLRTMRSAVSELPANDPFRRLLERKGVSKRAMVEAGQPAPELREAPFLIQLRAWVDNLRRLSDSAFDRVVFLFDEFDKLVESYRKGYRTCVEELLNQLRHAATEHADVGIVLAGSDLMRTVVGDYRNALFGSTTVLELSCFDDLSARVQSREIIEPRQLTGRREFGDGVIDQIVRLTGGHPLYMRLLGCAAAHLSQRRRVSEGVVLQALQALLEGKVLAGYVTDVKNTVVQPLQGLNLLETELDERLGRFLLIQMARRMTLEQPRVRWALLSNDEQMLELASTVQWSEVREKLRQASLIVQLEGSVWSFRFPILAEALKAGAEFECERLRSEIELIRSRSRAHA